MHTREEQLAAFGRLLDVMDTLREKCPWDRKQTFDSLRQNTIEEVFELATAISRHDMTEISKELGDVLLHVVFYAKMGSETNQFDIADATGCAINSSSAIHTCTAKPQHKTPRK